MNSTRVILAVGWLLASAAPRLEAAVAFVQTAPAQQSSQPEATPTSAVPVSPATAAPKPCPTVSPASSASQPDCKPTLKSKKRRHSQPPAPDSAVGPTKKVVVNGGTADPTVDISPGVSQQQASQQRETTNGLLAKTNENLKIIESRSLNAGQQDTVKQIRNYVKQSKDASDDGDVQRAYTLANKARMLSTDLVKH
ncbi:MAG: hypothetical protein ACLP6G_03310 [Terriglobales bacterium]